MARGAYALASLGNDTTTLQYFDLAFERQTQVGDSNRRECYRQQHQSTTYSPPLSTRYLQQQVLNGPTMEQTAAQVQARILSWLGDASGLPTSTLLKAYASSTADMSTRFSFKYACLRSVFGTPMFMVNQVLVPDLSADSTVKDWSKLLDPLLEAAGGGKREMGEGVTTKVKVQP